MREKKLSCCGLDLMLILIILWSTFCNDIHNMWMETLITCMNWHQEWFRWRILLAMVKFSWEIFQIEKVNFSQFLVLPVGIDKFSHRNLSCQVIGVCDRMIISSNKKHSFEIMVVEYCWTLAPFINSGRVIWGWPILLQLGRGTWVICIEQTYITSMLRNCGFSSQNVDITLGEAKICNLKRLGENVITKITAIVPHLSPC